MSSVRITWNGRWPTVEIDDEKVDVSDVFVSAGEVTLTLCPDDLELEGHRVVEKLEHQWISERVVSDRDDHERCVVCGRSRTVEVDCEAGE